MNRIYCDACKKEMPAEDYHEEILSYTDALKEKGDGAMIVNVEFVVKGKGEDRYWTRQFDLCPECQEKVNRVVMEALGRG